MPIQHADRQRKRKDAVYGSHTFIQTNELKSPQGSGLIPPQSEPAQGWSKESVIQAILVRLRDHCTMNAKAVYRESRPLYRAATRRFGNWSKALLAAGLDPDEYRKHCRPQTVPTGSAKESEK